MHVHFKQEETITVVKGRLATQVAGKEPQYFDAGATVSFKPGEIHKFWNAGSEPLIGKGYIKPAHNIEYFLTEIFASTKANGGTRPATFDAAYLLNKYKSEFDMIEIPSFVKKVIFPLTLFFGKLQGSIRNLKMLLMQYNKNNASNEGYQEFGLFRPRFSRMYSPVYSNSMLFTRQKNIVAQLINLQ